MPQTSAEKVALDGFPPPSKKRKLLKNEKQLPWMDEMKKAAVCKLTSRNDRVDFNASWKIYKTWLSQEWCLQ